MMQIEYLNRVFPVTVGDDGIFSVTFEGKALTADKLADLAARVRQHVNEAGIVDIPFDYLPDQLAALRRGHARGRHATRRTILVTWSDGSKDALYTHQGTFLRQLEGAARDEFTRLQSAYEAARKELHAFIAAHEFDLPAEVQKALHANGGS